MKKGLILLCFITLFNSVYALARTCDIEQTSGGDYGIREFKASGWVYILRGLSYEQAYAALKRLEASGRCN